jgi:hypothetical protein
MAKPTSQLPLPPCRHPKKLAGANSPDNATSVLWCCTWQWMEHQALRLGPPFSMEAVPAQLMPVIQLQVE